MFKKAIKILSIIFILFIGGCIIGLPVFPWIETHYYVEGTKLDLNYFILIKEPIGINIQDIYPEKEQCIDVCFTRNDQENKELKIKEFNFKANKSNGELINNGDIYLFGNDGSHDFNTLDSFKVYFPQPENYKKLRIILNLNKISELTFNIKALYEYQQKLDSFDVKMNVIKTHKLTFSRFSVH
jgi:hypothetical protein